MHDVSSGRKPDGVPVVEDEDGKLVTVADGLPAGAVPLAVTFGQPVEQRVVDVPDQPPLGGWRAERQARLDALPSAIPRYLRQRAELVSGLRFAARYYGRVSGFHAVRLPVYAGRLWGRAPRGAGRLVARWWRWVGYSDASEHQAGAKGGEWLALDSALSKERSRRRRTSAFVSVPVGFLVVAAHLLLPPVLSYAAAMGVLSLLGHVGRRQDQPIVHRYVSVYVQRKLGSDEVERALSDIGVKGRPNWTAPIAVDGPGWRAELDLPGASLAEEVLEKRAHLAAAMRRPLGCVWPETDRDAHPGRLVLWVAREDPARASRRIWPLMTTGQTDLFAEVPYGFDPRGRQVALRLMYSNLLIGGVMGSGKTSAVLVIALATALDPTAEQWIYEMKGSGDLDAVKPVCHRYVSGDDDEHCQAALRALYALEKEMKRRKAVIKDLPVELVPEGRKTSKRLAAQKELGLHPLVAIFDEVHTLFEHPDYGDEAAEVATRLVKKARAYGIVLVLTTQRPDAKSVPRGVSDNAITRLLLAVTGHVPNDLIAGTGAYKRGVRGTMFDPERDAGTAWIVRGLSANIARAAFIRQDEAVAIVRRAHALRIAAGTLTGQAAGEEVADADESTIVEHLTSVWPAGEETAHSARLVEALAVFRPDLYGPWLEQDQTGRSSTLASALRPYGVHTRQVNKRGDGGSAKGLRREDLVIRTTPTED